MSSSRTSRHSTSTWAPPAGGSSGWGRGWPRSGRTSRAGGDGEVVRVDEGSLTAPRLEPGPPPIVQDGERWIVNGSDAADHIQLVENDDGSYTVRVGRVNAAGDIEYVDHPLTDEQAANLVIRSGGGDDVIEVPPTSGLDITYWTADGDDLIGAGGENPLAAVGGDGDDRIFAGEGDDTVAGGAGTTRSAAATAPTPWTGRTATTGSSAATTAMSSTAGATTTSCPAGRATTRSRAAAARTSWAAARATTCCRAGATTTCSRAGRATTSCWAAGARTPATVATAPTGRPTRRATCSPRWSTA